MPKRIDFKLKDEQVDVLENALKTDKRTGVAQRATVVRLLHLGYTVPTVAEMVTAGEPIIYQWPGTRRVRFCAHGVDGLANQPRRQPSRKVSAEYGRLLEAALAQEPHEYGYKFAIWTRKWLVFHLAQATGIHIHVTWLQHLLNQLGYVCRHPKHDLRHWQAIAAKNNARAELEALKKTSSRTSSGFSLWMKRACIRPCARAG